ncbi:E3 ubiquitin-protein ligase FANCL-like isoform X2 [Dysidea avara]|uniref:E3 ubiquitin-protein ligase FANCL-like isoform X2 n=1 Tax=Dysidea avara TaxID=196820 RepID=UPI00331B96B1
MRMGCLLNGLYYTVLFMSYKLADACPHLLPSSLSSLSYDGFVNVSGKDFRISISAPNHDRLQDTRCDWHLTHMIQGYQHVIQKLLQQSKDLSEFIVEFKSLLNRVADCHHVVKQTPPPSYYQQLIEEINELGWDRVSYIDEGFTTIKISCRDSSNREHVLTVHLPEKYPSSPPMCVADLPVAFEPEWSSQDSLSTIVKMFMEELDKYQTFWNVVDELDHMTYVLEPETPTRASNTRRIFVARNVSVHIVIDPLHPLSFPECRFLGQDSATASLRQKLNSQLQTWDVNLSVLTNLSSLLDITFPKRPSQNEQQVQEEQLLAECCICYSYRLDGNTPEVVCDNDQCCQAFHHSCLFEWLKSVPTSRQSFNTIFGECPYCSKPISVNCV